MKNVALVLLAAFAAVLAGCAGQLNVAVTAETCAGSVTTTVIENGKLVDAHVSAKPGTKPQLEISGGGVTSDDVMVKPISLGKKAELKSDSTNWALHLFGWLDIAVTAIAAILGLSANSNGCQGSGPSEPLTYDVDGFAGDTAVTVGGLTFNILTAHCEDQVPNLTGLTEEVARTTIAGTCLVVGIVTQAYSDTVPAGQVISTSPSAGVTLDCGSAINLVISKGPAPTEMTNVPNVVGLTQAAATAALTAANLAVGTVTQDYSATIPAGSVISTSPGSGTSVAKGSAVALVVSKGPAPSDNTTVPNVVGMTQAAATAALNAANLVVGTVTQAYSDTVEAGKVISASPAAGTSVPKGSAVDLVVSKGPQPSAVLGVKLLTPLDGAVILSGSKVKITAEVTGPNPVDVVIVNLDGGKSLEVLGLKSLDDLFRLKVIPKGVYRLTGVTPPATVETTMDFVIVGSGGVTAQVRDTVTGETLAVSHTVSTVPAVLQ